MSAECNIANHEITLWMLHYGRNHAVYPLDIVLLDLNGQVVALYCTK